MPPEPHECRHQPPPPQSPPQCPPGRPRHPPSPALPLPPPSPPPSGLLWLSGFLPLPAFLPKYGGDSLWALVVFLGCGFACRRGSTVRIAVAALCLAWSIRVSPALPRPDELRGDN